MAILRMERAGQNVSYVRSKFRVLVDDEQVGVLKKWGDSADFEVAPGSHTVTIKTFGAKGSQGVDFVDGGVVDLLCGFGEGPIDGAPVLIWTRPAEEPDLQAIQHSLDRGEEFIESALPTLVEVADHLGLDGPKRDRLTNGHRIIGSLDGCRLELASGFFPGPGPAGVSPFLSHEQALAELAGMSEQEFLAKLDSQLPHPFWDYHVQYEGSPKSLGYKKRKHLPQGGLVLPDGSFPGIEDMAYRENADLVRQVKALYGDADDSIDNASVVVGPLTAQYTTKEARLTATDLAAKGQTLVDLVTQGVALLKR